MCSEHICTLPLQIDLVLGETSRSFICLLDFKKYVLLGIKKMYTNPVLETAFHKMIM